MKPKAILAAREREMRERHARGASPHTGRPREKQGRRSRHLADRMRIYFDELEAEQDFNRCYAVKTTWTLIARHALYYSITHNEFAWMHRLPRTLTRQQWAAGYQWDAYGQTLRDR